MTRKLLTRLSASVGLYAVQIASLFGFKVATVCSPRHFPLLHSLGAKHVFDYKDPEVVKKIQIALPNLKYIFDTIGNETSSATASTAMREAGGILCTVRPSKEFTEHVSSRTKVTSILVFTSFLKEHQMGSRILPVSRNYKLKLSFCYVLTFNRHPRRTTNSPRNSIRRFLAYLVRERFAQTPRG